MEILNLTMQELSARLVSGDVSSVEATEASLSQIEQTTGMGAWLHVAGEHALTQARASDLRRKEQKSLGPLDGIPLGLKDIFLTRDIPTTCGSKILDGFLPPYNAHVVEQLDATGAVMLGKLNMDEFAMGSSNEHSAYGPVFNPWGENRVPGGSSGGSAAQHSVLWERIPVVRYVSQRP